MIIAAAKTIENMGYNPQQVMFFSAVDIDKKCFEMTFIQASLLGLCGEVVWGDSLCLKSWRVFNTLLYFSKPWQERFKFNKFMNVIRELMFEPKDKKEETDEKSGPVGPQIIQQPVKADLIVDKNGQIKLF